MSVTRRSLTIGILIALLAAGFTVFEHAAFFSLGGWGKALFALMLVLCALSGAAIAVRPDRERERFRPRWYTVWLIIVFALAPLIMVMAVERLNGNFIWELYDTSYLFDNYAVAFVCYMAAFAVFGSVRVSILAMSPVFLFFGIANMYVKEFKGSPLLPMDAGAIATAAKVAGGYDYSFGFEMVVAAILTLFIMALASRLAMPPREKRARICLHLVPLVIVLATLGVFYGTDLPVQLGMKPDFFNQTRGYENRGAIGQFACNTRYIINRAPSGYNAETVEELLSPYEYAEDTGQPSAAQKAPYILTSALTMQADADGAEAAQTYYENLSAQMTGAGDNAAATSGDAAAPDIIIVMNESFADLQSVVDFDTNLPVTPNLDSLTENTIHGDAYVSVRGTGTSNTEYELLTGNSMAFLPAGSNAYQLYLRGEQPGLVSTLTSLGYSTEAMHPYFAANWNRPAVYKDMGFGQYLSIENLFDDDFGTGYLATGDNQRDFVNAACDAWPGEQVMVAGYTSDHYDYRKLIESYEARDTSKPWFHFNITMQNHSPYDSFYGNFERSVHVDGTSVTYYQAENYLSRIRESDRALGELIDYFKEVDHPVILLFFGDHQPIVEPEFFEEVSGKPLEDWTDEELQELYRTPFILWANYDIPEGTVDRISVNYLHTLLLQTAGLPMTAYDNYLADLYRQYPVITAQGCRDRVGHFFKADDPGADLAAPADERAAKALQDYSYITYNNLSDDTHKAEKAFYLGR